MSDERSLFERLAESVGPMAHLPTGAAYHTGEQIITHLNRVLGPETWSFIVMDSGFEEDSDECWVFGQITTTIGGIVVVKQDYGSQAMKRNRTSGKWISKGEDRKAATTDCLKRCARLLGVGLDAWANERAPSWRPDTDDEKDAPAPQQSGRPSTNPSGADLGRAAAMVGDFTTNTDGDPVCMLDIGERMCGRNVLGWDARGDYPARSPAQVAEWQIKKAEFGMPLCIAHQKAIKDGKVKAIRWQPPAPALRVVGDEEPPVRPDDDELPF